MATRRERIRRSIASCFVGWAIAFVLALLLTGFRFAEALVTWLWVAPIGVVITVIYILRDLRNDWTN
ncbi:putative membrane protein [Arthrobacter sp. 2762]